MRRIVPFMVGFLVLSAPALTQTPIPIGDEFRVNTYTTSEQRRPSVAMTPGGDFVVVWTSNEQDGDSWGVFGQRYDYKGIAVGAEFQVNTYTTFTQHDIDVAVDDSGAIVVVWRTYDPWGIWVEVYGRRFDSSGQPAGAEFQVNTHTPHFQRSPKVASASGGEFVIVWSDYLLDGGCCSGVFARLYDANGLPQGDQFQVNTHTTGGQSVPDVAMGPDGDFVVVWSGRGEGDTSGVFGQRFGAAGLPADDEFQINSYTTNGQYGPGLATDKFGNFVVVWTSASQDGDDNLGIFGQRFDAAGQRVGIEFQVNTYTTDWQWKPAVAMDASGDFVVSWSSHGQDGDRDGIFSQSFRKDGTPSGDEFQVNTTTSSVQDLPSVAARRGEFVVTWGEGPGPGDNYGVFGQRFLAGVTFLDGFESGDTSAWSSTVE